MAKRKYIRSYTPVGSIENVAGDIEAIKRLASAVIIQAKRDYERGYMTEAALHQFCCDSWVWSVLDIDGESVERGIRNDS